MDTGAGSFFNEYHKAMKLVCSSHKDKVVKQKSNTDLRIRKCVFIYLGFYIAFNTTGHITFGSFVGRGNQYIQLVKVLHCKLPTISKQLRTSPQKIRDLNR